MDAIKIAILLALACLPWVVVYRVIKIGNRNDDDPPLGPPPA